MGQGILELETHEENTGKHKKKWSERMWRWWPGALFKESHEKRVESGAVESGGRVCSCSAGPEEHGLNEGGGRRPT